MSKVVFLDIDGVLVTKRSLKGCTSWEKSAVPDCIEALNRLTAESGAEIVVSSAWRLDGLDSVREVLQVWKVSGNLRGITPDLSRTEEAMTHVVPRGREIKAWLAQNPDVQSYVILDDERDMDGLDGKLIHIACDYGLTAEDVSAALRML